MRKPKLNAIKMFEVAARHANFRLAAEELHLTQGAVAQAVRGLEQDLDLKLFQRHARGLELTPVGTRFHSEVARGLAIIDQAVKSIHPVANAITISVPPSFASKWLVPKLPGFIESQPGLEVRILASEVVTDFSAHDVDVAIRQGDRPADPSLGVDYLAPVTLCAFGSPAASLPTGPVECLSELAHLPLIQDSHRYWERMLSAIGAEVPNQMLQFNQTALALDAAANGQGLAIAPHLIGASDVASKRLTILWQDQQPAKADFWVVYPTAKRAANSEAKTALIDWLKRACDASQPDD